MKNKIKIPLPYILFLLFWLITIAVCIIVFPIQNTASLINFTTTVVSLMVATFAFYRCHADLSFSIDSVNAITKMEGNVLENENYVTSFPYLIRKYDDQDSKRIGDKVFEQLEKSFKKNSKTAIEFAENLQDLIDIIVFFPYLFNGDKKYREDNIESMVKLLKLIDGKRKSFFSVSTGNLILINETVELIESIISYQQHRLSGTKDKQRVSKILDVRGNMLKNPVTQTVYCNYLGLYYNSKAYSVLGKKYGLENIDFFSIDGLMKVKESMKDLSFEEKELLTLYLNEARVSFSKALQNGSYDVMWEGFIKYNDARAAYLLQLVLGKETVTSDGVSEWESIMNQAIISRNRLTILFSDILESQGSYLFQKAFQDEKDLASLVKINIQIVNGQDITNTINEVKYKAPHYTGLLEDPTLSEPSGYILSKVTEHQQRIKQYLS